MLVFHVYCAIYKALSGIILFPFPHNRMSMYPLTDKGACFSSAPTPGCSTFAFISNSWPMALAVVRAGRSLCGLLCKSRRLPEGGYRRRYEGRLLIAEDNRSIVPKAPLGHALSWKGSVSLVNATGRFVFTQNRKELSLKSLGIPLRMQVHFICSNKLCENLHSVKVVVSCLPKLPHVVSKQSNSNPNCV